MVSIDKGGDSGSVDRHEGEQLLCKGKEDLFSRENNIGIGNNSGRERLGSSGGGMLSFASNVPSDSQTVFSQLGISNHLQDFLMGSSISTTTTPLYADIIEDVNDLASSSSSSSSSYNNSYFGLARISSCYRKHTQSSAFQSAPLFKISFSGDEN